MPGDHIVFSKKEEGNWYAVEKDVGHINCGRFSTLRERRVLGIANDRYEGYWKPDINVGEQLPHFVGHDSLPPGESPNE